MQTLTEENRELRIKIANLEQAFGASTFELSQKLPEARLAAGRCAEILPGLTVSNPPEAIDWYGEVLGAKEVFRVETKMVRSPTQRFGLAIPCSRSTASIRMWARSP